MKEHFISFPDYDIREILTGVKNQFRRPLPVQPLPLEPPSSLKNYVLLPEGNQPTKIYRFVYPEDETLKSAFFELQYRKGDRLLLCEHWAYAEPSGNDMFEYRATHQSTDKITFMLPIDMPRVACRIELEIEEVSIEKLSDITEDDSKNEGLNEFLLEQPYLQFLQRTSLKNQFFSKWNFEHKHSPILTVPNLYVSVMKFKRVF